MNAWDESYRQGVPPPWDIGRPQPEFVRLVESGIVTGRVIDVGCGTGENALMAAAHGLEVVGVDVARTAVEQAQAKAAERGLAAAFHVWDGLELDGLVELMGAFDSAIDSGVFHTFSDEDRPAYVAGVGALASSARTGLTGRTLVEVEGPLDLVILTAAGLVIVWQLWLAARLWRGSAG